MSATFCYMGPGYAHSCEYPGGWIIYGAGSYGNNGAQIWHHGHQLPDVPGLQAQEWTNPSTCASAKSGTADGRCSGAPASRVAAPARASAPRSKPAKHVLVAGVHRPASVAQLPSHVHAPTANGWVVLAMVLIIVAIWTRQKQLLKLSLYALVGLGVYLLLKSPALGWVWAQVSGQLVTDLIMLVASLAALHLWHAMERGVPQQAGRAMKAMRIEVRDRWQRINEPGGSDGRSDRQDYGRARGAGGRGDRRLSGPAPASCKRRGTCRTEREER